MAIYFFRTPKPKKFHYQPVFYDPEAEELKLREQRIKQELGLSDDEAKRVSMIKGQFKRQYEQRRMGRKSGMSSIRLLVILAILVLLSYYIFY